MKQNKRVLLVSNTAWSIFNFRLVLAKFIGQNGCYVQAMAPRDDYSNKLIQSGIPFKHISIDNKGSNPVKDLLLLFSFFLKYIKTNPDLIIHYTIKPNIYGSIAARLLGKKSIAVVTGLGYAFIQRGFTTKLVMVMYKVAFMCSNRVLFLNETDRTFFCRLKIVNRHKTTVLPGEGIDTVLFKPMEAKLTDACTFLFVGRLLFDKGLGELIDAMRLLKKVKPEARLQIVGFLDALNPTAVSKETLDQWIAEGLVEFLGASTDVRKFISHANCVVLPSYREGVSRTLLEAASMAKPIIATDVVGCREIVKHQISGFLCKVKNANSLFESMLAFTNLSLSQQEQMGNQGRIHVEQNFADEQVLNTYVPLFESLLKNAFNLNHHKSEATISIITVIFDNHAFIGNAIESVLAQSHPNIQYIVVDGGSTDGSLAIIQSYADNINVIVSEPDEGIYDAMNKGLALATGDIIGFLNADDFYAHTNVIQQVASRFMETGCEVLYADLDYVARADKHKIVRKWRSGNYQPNKFKHGWMPPHPTFFAKKELYQKFGGYKQELNSSADYELMLRFCYVNKAQTAYLPDVLVKMRLGGQSNRSFKNRILANLQDRKAWEINGLTPAWYTFLLKPLSKIKQYFI